MTLHLMAQIVEMTGTWQIIEEALGRKKPPKKIQWLADKLGVSAQVMTNWKKRGVPAARLRAIADALGLTLDQVEGLAPLPWERASAWPFQRVSLPRVLALSETDRAYIEGRLEQALEQVELLPMTEKETRLYQEATGQKVKRALPARKVR